MPNPRPVCEFKIRVITGFNTDVKYDGVTYHVQTEDKGLDTPLILSLVYQHGTILASKRSSYEKMVGAGFDEKVLEQMLQRQHKLMCAAVQTGRLEDLKRMTIQNARENKAVPVREKEDAPLELGLEQPETKPQIQSQIEQAAEKTVTQDIPAPKILDRGTGAFEEPTPPEAVPEIEGGEFGEQKVWDIPITDGIEIIDDDEFFDEGFVLSPDAIKIVDDFAAVGAGLDEELKIKFLADYVFRSGEKKNVNLLVCRGPKEKEVENASIMIKVLGSAFRPIIFHAKTDKHGVATVFVKLPTFRSGRAAILVRASTEAEETELRRVILHQ